MNKTEQYQSRKYKLALIALCIITCGWVAGSYFTTLSGTFDELITGVMGLLMLYYTGNVGNKFVVGRYLNQKQSTLNQHQDQSGNH